MSGRAIAGSGFGFPKTEAEKQFEESNEGSGSAAYASSLALPRIMGKGDSLMWRGCSAGRDATAGKHLGYGSRRVAAELGRAPDPMAVGGAPRQSGFAERVIRAIREADRYRGRKRNTVAARRKPDTSMTQTVGTTRFPAPWATRRRQVPAQAPGGRAM